MSLPSQNRCNDSFELFLNAYQRTADSLRLGSVRTAKTCAKIPLASYASTKRLTSKSSPSLARDCSVPSLNVPVVKLQQCDEEFDEMLREAKFAFRKTDLGSWENSARTSSPSSSSSGGTNTNSDPNPIQHWAVVIHFPRGNLTYVFEAYEDEETGHLEGYRARHVDYEVFKKAKYFGTAVTSPCELLEIAKQVRSNGTPYSLIDNNCQTWLKEFLQLISPDLGQSFDELLVKLNLPIIFGFACLFLFVV